jgi:NAD(P)H-hydrate epimerase
MYLVSSGEMKEIEKKTIEKYGIPALILMENAGINVVDAIRQETGSLFMKRVNVFCGGGNNGGDGFVAARHLKTEGAVVRIFFTGEYKNLSNESKLNYDAAMRYGIDIVNLKSIDDLKRYEGYVKSCDIVVDALIGTGIKNDVKGFMANLIVYINLMGKYTVSVDIQSGADPDTGDIKAVAVYSSLTVTFGLPKIGLTLYPALEYTGKLIVADINFPSVLLSVPRKHVLITGEIAAPMMPYRQPNANKGHFGPILIIGGSPGMTGAVVLASKAALRAGAGLVIAAVSESFVSAVKSRSDEVVVVGLKENNEGAIAAGAYDKIMELVERAKIVVIGPGMGKDKETQSLIKKLVKDIKKPLVIDADGLNALENDKTCLKNMGKDVILTPHIGEMSRLTGMRIEDIIKDKIGTVKDFVTENKVNVILKDGRSILSDIDLNIYINTTGNSGMATPGCGDVLTGIIASFMAHNMTSVQAGIAANFIHGLAGDMLLSDMSEEGITAEDIITQVPKAIKALKK